MSGWVLTLGYGSGHNLTVCGFKPHVRLCTDSMEPAWESLSSSLSAPPLFGCSFSLSQKKLIKKKKQILSPPLSHSSVHTLPSPK